MSSWNEWWLFLYAIVLILGTIANILVIGKPREPMTAGTVALVTIISVITLFAIAATLTS